MPDYVLSSTTAFPTVQAMFRSAGGPGAYAKLPSGNDELGGEMEGLVGEESAQQL